MSLMRVVFLFAGAYATTTVDIAADGVVLVEEPSFPRDALPEVMVRGERTMVEVGVDAVRTVVRNSDTADEIVIREEPQPAEPFVRSVVDENVAVMREEAPPPQTEESVREQPVARERVNREVPATLSQQEEDSFVGSVARRLAALFPPEQVEQPARVNREVAATVIARHPVAQERVNREVPATRDSRSAATQDTVMREEQAPSQEEDSFVSSVARRLAAVFPTEQVEQPARVNREVAATARREPVVQERVNREVPAIGITRSAVTQETVMREELPLSQQGEDSFVSSVARRLAAVLSSNGAVNTDS